MRRKTVMGLAVAAGAAAAAVGIGGAALASGQAEPSRPAVVDAGPAVPQGQDNTVPQGQDNAAPQERGAAGSASERDCPEKVGPGTESSENSRGSESGASDQADPATL